MVIMLIQVNFVEFYDSDKSGDSVKTGGNSCESSDNGDFGDSCKF